MKMAALPHMVRATRNLLVSFMLFQLALPSLNASPGAGKCSDLFTVGESKSAFSFGKSLISVPVKWTQATLKKLAMSLPIIYINPYNKKTLWVGVTKPIDVDLVDQHKAEYRGVVNQNLDVIQAGNDPVTIRTPKSNEEKLALIEVVAEALTEKGLDSSSEVSAKDIIGKLRQERLRDLTVMLARWKSKKNPLSATELMWVMDYYYMSSNRAYFAILENFRSVFLPQEGLRELFRRRWESELAKHDLLIALQRMNMASVEDGMGLTWGELASVSLSFAMTASVNWYSIQRIGVPVMWPDFSFYRMPNKRAKNAAIIEAWKDGKITQEEAIDRFITENKKTNFSEYYHRWLRRFWPIIVSVAMINAQYGTFTYMKNHMDLFLKDAVVKQAVSREDLENQAFEKLHHETVTKGVELWTRKAVEDARKVISEATFEELQFFLNLEAQP